MIIAWHDSEDEKPDMLTALWITTAQQHVNLAWYYGDRFYPYGIPLPGSKPFGDKHGDCDVIAWSYAEIPEAAQCA